MRITKYKTLLDDNKMCQLVKDNATNYTSDTEFNNPEAVYKMLCDVFKLDKQSEEYLYLLVFNNRCKLYGVFEISHGSVSASICEPRDIFQKILLCNGTGFILAHNHPSGNAVPSNEDVKIAKRIKEASCIMGINFLDNLVVGDNSYTSFNEMKLM